MNVNICAWLGMTASFLSGLCAVPLPLSRVAFSWLLAKKQRSGSQKANATAKPNLTAKCTLGKHPSKHLLPGLVFVFPPP